jgi:hypothetical protein
MSTHKTLGLVVLGLVLLWGVMGLVGTTATEDGNHRFVVENEYNESRTITATIYTDGGEPIITETRALSSEEQWVVDTVDASRIRDGYTMGLSGEHSSDFERSRGGPGATLIEMGGGRTGTCGDDPTCYR